MNLQYPFRIDDIDLNNITYDNKKIKESENKKIIFLKYIDNNKLKNFVFQLPILTDNYKIIDNELEINLECYDPLNNDSLLHFFNELDNKIISEGKKNINWFNHLTDKSSIKYKKIINDNNYAGSITLKIIKNNEFETKLLLNDIDNININQIPYYSLCKIMIECYAIWISDSYFGLLIRPIIISFTTKLLYNYKLIDEQNTETGEKLTSDEIYKLSPELENNNDYSDLLFIKTDYNDIINLESSD